MTTHAHVRGSARTAAPDQQGDGRVELRGWGRNTSARCTVLRPRKAEEIPDLIAGCRPPFIGRGLGRAYGDAATMHGGTVVDLTYCQQTIDFVAADGLIQVEVGLALDTLTARVLPHGWIPPVLPGTGRVTVGGALAADVHGKNQRSAGSFADHVSAFELVTPDGQLRTIRRDSEEFLATAGGMGLTGVIARVTMTLQPAPTAYVLQATWRVPDLAAACDALEHSGAEHAAAWLDGFATGVGLGRGVVSEMRAAAEPDVPARLRSDPAAGRAARARRVPARLLLRPSSVRAANAARWHRAPQRPVSRLRRLVPALHPLDRVQNWPAWYGRDGLLQYQFVVPLAGRDLLPEVLHRLIRCGYPPYLAVLKRFGRSGSGLLSFPIEGWCLALDLPDGNPPLRTVLNGLDGVIAAAGGRVYLAKDSRMRADLVETMYPELPQWRRIRDRLDPDRALQSDLSRRLGLVDGNSR